MIKKFLALAIGVALVSTGCSKDDENTGDGTNGSGNGGASATLEETMPGTWDVTKIEQKNGTTDFGGTQITFSGIASNINYMMEFKNDGSFNASGSYTMDLTMSFMGQTIPQSTPVNATSSGTWKVTADGELEIKVPGEDAVAYEVLSKSSNKIELMATVEVEQEIQGQTSKSTLDSYITIEK